MEYSMVQRERCESRQMENLSELAGDIELICCWYVHREHSEKLKEDLSYGTESLQRHLRR